MSYYALTDSDWPWDDEGEGRAIVVHADTPQDAIRIATDKHIAENPGAGGICWRIARLWEVGFEMVEWEDDNKPKYIGFYPYPDRSNENDVANLREKLRLLMSRHAGGEKREDTYKDGFQQGLAAAIDEIDKIPATQFVALATIPPDCAIGEFYGFTETTTLYRIMTESVPSPKTNLLSQDLHAKMSLKIVKRYEEHPDGGMRADIDGSFVKYEDYISIIEEKHKTIELLQDCKVWVDLAGDMCRDTEPFMRRINEEIDRLMND